MSITRATGSLIRRLKNGIGMCTIGTKPGEREPSPIDNPDAHVGATEEKQGTLDEREGFGCAREGFAAAQRDADAISYVERRSGPRGIRVHWLYYQGSVLQEHRRTHGDREVTVRVDETNMGGVSVLIGGTWARLHCTAPGLDGVTLRDWIATAAAVRKPIACDAETTDAVFVGAIRAG